MLSKVLNKSTCAECRFCCSFRRSSLWETPLFSEEKCENLSKDNQYGVKAEFDLRESDITGSRCGQMKLEHKYKTEDVLEEAACEFLNPDKGCILSEEDKPFDCKIWPLRIMKKDDKLVIVLTPTCPAVGETPSKEMTELVENGLGQKIYDYAIENPFIIKEYHKGFPVIMSFENK